MATKWRKFTALTGVKVICFLLIVTLGYAIADRLFTCSRRSETENVHPEIVFSDLSDYGVFYDYHMPGAYNYVYTAARYKSEASILAGEHIKWELDTAYEYWNNGKIEYGYEYRLKSADGSSGYAVISVESYNNLNERKGFEQNAVNQQISEYRNALRALSDEHDEKYNTAGVLYYTELDGIIFSNVAPENQSIEFFKSQPVYIVTDENGFTERSHSNNYDFGIPPRTGSAEQNAVICVAFPREVVDSTLSWYAVVKAAYVRDFITLKLMGILAAFLLFVLLCGSGRRISDGGAELHFTLIDKLYLDIGLALAIGVIFVAFVILENVFHYAIYNSRDTSSMRVLFASGAIGMIPLPLLWLMCFAKRVKAGRFWRHTLIFAFPYAIVRFVKSLWVGFPLMLKVGIISFASFLLFLIMALAGWSHAEFAVFILMLLLTAVTAFFLLMYAKRIRKLDLGAAAASRGDYSTIEVGRGELGSIANSINNISAGINTAIEERMKSERLKTELITNVSHDIRTPLTSIITYTDLLKNEGLSCAKAPEYLDVLIQKSQRLKTLTDELFEAAKASTGNIEVNITELDITELINQVLGELESAIASSGLDLRVNLPEHMIALADGKLMWRVMENLLSNVFKYALHASRVYLDAERDGALVRINLKNISAEELNVDPSELTERFKRGDDSRTDGGNGLGLSIVQSFVQAQGGSFNISIDGDLFKATVQLKAKL